MRQRRLRSCPRRIIMVSQKPDSRGEGMKRIGSLLFAFIALVVATVAGLGIGYLLWDQHPNWYAVDVNKLGPGPEADLIRYGRDLIVNTPPISARARPIPPCAMPAMTSPARTAT